MSVAQKMVGDMVAEWSNEHPLKWNMSQYTGPKNERRFETISLNLSDFSDGFEESFLLELKNFLILRRMRVALNTVYTEYNVLRNVLGKYQLHNVGKTRVSVINIDFLRSLQNINEEFSGNTLARFKRLFNSYPESPIYANDLTKADYPVKTSIKGQIGDNIDRVLASALSRATCVEIFRRSENAFELGEIDIGCFAFLNLAFHIYCRASSYRRITTSDLQVDIDPETHIKSYFIWVFPKKTGISQKKLKKISYPLDKTVGELLEAQRINVINTWGHLVSNEDVGKLALFPAKAFAEDGGWKSKNAREHFGEPTHGSLKVCYLLPIYKILNSIKFNLTDLRHTVGTQLAVAGCSATTIAAVLKHANNDACQKYVDIAFEGVINTLSDELEPGFDAHFPAYNLFRSKKEPVAPEKAINSIDLTTGRRELTGECGKKIACQYAPIACYSCPRFTPCFDADHGINLDIVNAEISKYEQGGQPFQQLTNQYKDARRYILLVVASANQVKSNFPVEDVADERVS